MRIYLDTAPVIYLVEQVQPYVSEVTSKLSQTDVVLVSSDLTRLECLVKPFRDNDLELLEDYRIQFDEAMDEVVSLNSDIMIHAAQIRALHGLKTPDAIHLAAAITSNCDSFLTNDKRLSGFKEIPIEVVSDSNR